MQSIIAVVGAGTSGVTVVGAKAGMGLGDMMSLVVPAWPRGDPCNPKPVSASGDFVEELVNARLTG